MWGKSTNQGFKPGLQCPTQAMIIKPVRDHVLETTLEALAGWSEQTGGGPVSDKVDLSSHYTPQ